MAKPLAALAVLCFAHAAIGFRAVPPAMTTSVASRPQFYGKPWQRAMRRVLKPIRKPAGWFLVYADVSPYDESTAEGAAFIATNVVFFALGAQLATAGGDPFLGALVELAGTGSVAYHYSQCALGGTNRPAVQLAMLVDYAFALPSILLFLPYAASLGDALPAGAVACAAASLASLAAGWVWDGPRQYFVLHGAWHVLGAAAASQCAAAHALIQ